MSEEITTNRSVASLSSSFQRSDSEETIILDEEENLLKTDETRSNDDSSSGIVISDRNNGSSSVSLEEIEPATRVEEVTMSYENHLLLEEQNEPENLSLKEHKVEREEIPKDFIIYNNNKCEESPVDLAETTSPRKLSCTSEFLGFPAWYDDDNFPFFGFDRAAALNEKQLNDKLSSLVFKDEVAEPQLPPKRRGRKRKIVDESPKIFEPTETRRSKRIALENISKQLKPDAAEFKEKTPSRRGRPPAFKTNLVAANVKAVKPLVVAEKRGKRKLDENEGEEEEEAKNDKPKSKRGRPPKSVKNSPKETKKAAKKSKQNFHVPTEAFSNVASSIKFDKKPQSAQRTIIEKPETVQRAKRQRRPQVGENFVGIKPERPQAQPTVIISYQQSPAPPPQPPPPTFLSSRFLQQMNYVRSWYINNNEQPSYIGRIPKAEAKERPAIRVTTKAS